MGYDLLYRLWGKTNDREAAPGEAWCWHPALCHMLDVAYVAERWLHAHSFLLDKLAHAAHANSDALRPVLLTLAALHDLGKLHPRFQAKSPQGWAQGYAQAKLNAREFPGDGFDHGLATARMLYTWSRLEDPSWKPYLPAIRAVAAHHGRFHEVKRVKREPMSNWYACSPAQQAVGEALKIIPTLFGFRPDAPLDGAVLDTPAFLMLLAGFVSVADWIGSIFSQERTRPDGPGLNVTDAESATQYLDALRTSGQADEMLRAFGLLPRFHPQPRSYSALFSFISTDTDLRPLQRRALDLPFGQEPGPELVIVEAPMGMGKTEIALYLAACALHACTADGLYFALPTQASANALLNRIGAFAERVGAPGQPIGLALAHSARALVKSFDDLRRRAHRALQRSSTQAVETSDDETPGEAVAPAWLQSSKRALLAPVGLGTVDQAMLGAIRVRHAFVRLYALGRHVVVLDEIHAYDVYMSVVLRRLLVWLHAMECKVILLSATLPRTLRADLLTTFQVSEPATDAPPERDPYPQMLHAQDGKLTAYRLSQKELPTSRQIRVQLLEAIANERTQLGADAVLEAAKNGGCVAWIRNTVKEAQAAWRVLHARAREKAIPLILLHARFTRADRNRIERDLVARLGPPDATDAQPRPPCLIVVATQVIEQSVDLDFDVMFSDLAPVDLLLQRAGRLHRHHRPLTERQGHDIATLHVLLPSADERARLDFGSSGYIYDPEILARTAVLLCEPGEIITWMLPDACRTLVARLYDEPERWTAQRLGLNEEVLTEARHKHDTQQTRMKQRAKKILMPLPGKKLEMPDARREHGDEQHLDLVTRYSEVQSVMLVLLRLDADMPRLLGVPDLSLHPLPHTDDVDATLMLEHAVAASSVSFPWYADVEAGEVPGSLSPLVRWWQRRHRHDDRLFLLLNPDGTLQHPAFVGRYATNAEGHAVEGLLLSRPGQAPPDAVPLEDL